MKLNRRSLWMGAIALLALVVLTLFVAPNRTPWQSGSTYGRSPAGYGAWYAYMQQQGTPLQRWQKPLTELFGNAVPQPQKTTAQTSGRLVTDVISDIAKATTIPPNGRITLLRISDNPFVLENFKSDWVAQGNILVLLGVSTRVTKAPFSSSVPTPLGIVRVETSRRHHADDGSRLGDSFGAVVWEQAIGQGKVIYASTPYLAANAYQDYAGNYEFLAKLVTEAGYPLWVDEYLHGYKDKQVIQRETGGNIVTYLAKTPLMLIAVQAFIVLLVLLWGQNRRFGQAIALTPPVVNNSQAYIQAMAQVLQKAESSEFVVEAIAKAEHLTVQRALGLGTDTLPPETIVAAWVQQTQRPASELQAILTPRRHHLSEPDLLRWLEQIQQMRRQLPS